MSDYGMFILDDFTLDSGYWLAYYDVNANDGAGEALGTTNPAEALRFPDLAAVMQAWKEQSTVQPLRMDGQPNRPLTAYTIQPRRLP